MNMVVRSKVKTLCFTGHRPDRLGGYEPNNPVALWVKERLRGAVDLAVSRGVSTFISGGALGVDQGAADIVFELRAERQKRSPTGLGGIKLVIARPFPSQLNRWPLEARQHYEKILRQPERSVPQ